MPLLSVEQLRTHFFTDDGVVKAVDDVSFTVEAGETLAIVGESGCGKSVTALSLLRLIATPPGRIVGGAIHWTEATGKRVDLLQLSLPQMRALRGRDLAMIFQEPMTSLNPVMSVGRQIAEVLEVHGTRSRPAVATRVLELLRQVGIPEPESRAQDYPHQLSGGMRQRIMIAMALACRPRVLIADEPTTALDVTIQAQILVLLQQLQREYGMGLILITHDLGVVAQIADRVAVMYAGKIVEMARVQELYRSPRHPYTAGLLRAIPPLEKQTGQRLATIPGRVPNLAALPPGCAFLDRCPRAQAMCRHGVPPLEDKAVGQAARCYFAHEYPHDAA